MIGQAFLGASLILLLGVLLALAAAGLPRLAARWEGPGAGERDLLAEAAPSRAMPPVEAPAMPGARPGAAPPAPVPAAEEEALIAAAVALALSLYQGEAGGPQREPLPTPGGASPWALSGRLGAMQARTNWPRRK
jgi:hypothetical protein